MKPVFALVTLAAIVLLAIDSARPQAQEEPAEGESASPERAKAADPAASEAGVSTKPAVEMKTQIVLLTNSHATEMVKALGQLGYQSDTMAIIPDLRSNSILLRGGPPERLKEVIAMIGELDRLGGRAKYKPARELETRRFTLKHRQAGWAIKLLQNGYRDLISADTVLMPDEDARTLFVRAPKNVLQAIEAVLPDVDTPSVRAAEDAFDAAPEPETNGAAGGASERNEAARDFRRQDTHALELAGELRKLQAADQPDQERIKQLTAQLQESVTAAFAARQRWQFAELKTLQQRVRKLEGVVQSREGTKAQIIQRRIEELLHPEQSWGSSDGPQASLARPNEDQAERGWKRAEYHLRRGEQHSAAVYAEQILRDSPQSPRAADARDLLRKLGPDYAQGKVSGPIDRDATSDSKSPATASEPRSSASASPVTTTNDGVRSGLLQKLTEVKLEIELQRATLSTAREPPAAVSEQEIAEKIAGDAEVVSLKEKLSAARQTLNALRKDSAPYARREQEIEEMQRKLAALAEALSVRTRESLHKAHEEDRRKKSEQSKERLAELVRLAKALEERIAELDRKTPPAPPAATPTREVGSRSDHAGGSAIAFTADAADPRRILIDAEVAASLAREGVSAAELKHRNLSEQLGSKAKLAEKGFVTAAEIEHLQAEIAAAEGEIREARLRSTAAERQMQIARDGLDARFNLLQLETELARSKLDHAAARHARAKDLAEKKAITTNALQTAEIELMEAQLQHERSRMQLDLYAKAKAAASSSREKQAIPDQSSVEARKHKLEAQANDLFWQAIGLKVVPGSAVVTASSEPRGRFDGLRVIEVQQDGPAAAAGMKLDDVLISLNAQATATMRGGAAIVAPHGRPRPDDLKFVVVRGDEHLTGTIRVKPAQPARWPDESQPEGDSQDESRSELRKQPGKSAGTTSLNQGQQSAIWMTDFDAAVAQSKESGRLLLAFYDGKNEQSKAMQKEWFDNPEVQKLLGAVYVAVRIEDDNGPTCMIVKDGNLGKPVFKIVGNTNLGEPFHEKDGIVRLLESLAGVSSSK